MCCSLHPPRARIPDIVSLLMCTPLGLCGVCDDVQSTAWRGTACCLPGPPPSTRASTPRTSPRSSGTHLPLNTTFPCHLPLENTKIVAIWMIKYFDCSPTSSHVPSLAAAPSPARTAAWCVCSWRACCLSSCWRSSRRWARSSPSSSCACPWPCSDDDTPPTPAGSRYPEVRPEGRVS